MDDKHLYNEDSQRVKEAARLAKQLREQSLDIDEYLSEDEWKQYLNSGNAGRNHDIPDDAYRPVYNATLRKTKLAKTIYKSVGLILILCFCGGAFYFLYNATKPRLQAPVAYDHTNSSASPQRIQLPDGSTIILQPGSNIHYAADYNIAVRDLQLTGHAEFQVARDDSRPLTVYCREVATTALGTRFSVSGTGTNVVVHLYEGKVRVRDTSNTITAIYPLPGETFAYVAAEQQFVAVDINGLPLVSKKMPTIAAKPKKAVIPVQNNAYLTFQNAALTDVFDYLAEYYKVEIRYPTDVALSTNTLVSVDKGLPVASILENICRTNNMKVKASGDTLFIISK